MKKRVFKNKDYISGDGMLTTVWGPSMWHFLHTMSFNYPVNPSAEDKQHYKEFMLSLVHILPCKYCRQNLANNYKLFPLKASDMASRDSFSRYVYKLHELVNKLLKKKSGLSYCDVRERYEHFRSRCTSDKPKIFNLKEEMKEVKSLAEKETGASETGASETGASETGASETGASETGKNNKTLKKNKKEKGCTEPLYGKKSKCIIKIVPQEEKCKTMQIDKKCIKRRD